MITQQQWNALNEYLTERITKEDKFYLSDETLRKEFGITRPFWADMCKFAQAVERNYTGDRRWWTSDGEPTEIEYSRRKDEDE